MPELEGLAPQHLRALEEESGIQDDLIRQRGYRTVSTKSALKDLGFSQN